MAHWKNVPMTTFQQYDITMLLARFTTLSKVLSETDESGVNCQYFIVLVVVRIAAVWKLNL